MQARRRTLSWMLLAALALPACGQASAGDGSASRAAPLEWGLYQILWERDYGARLDATLADFARPPAYVMFYRDLGRPYPAGALDAVHARGATPLVSLELGHWHRPADRELPVLVAGDYDAHFEAWARAAAADGRRLLLRFGFEANGDWFGWGGDPQRFVAAWRRVHALFDRAGATNVEWVWSPNVVSVPDTPENDMHRYYPGDAYVDWVGLDGYNWGDGHDPWHRWESFGAIFDEALADLARRYPDARLMVCETGSAPDDRKAEWIADAWRAARAHPRLEAVVWFHLDKRREGEHDWRLDSSPGSLEAFNASFAAPRGPG